jgi:hypothetical protein
MSLLKTEIGQIVAGCSEADQKILLGELVKKFVTLSGSRKGISLRDSDDKPVGYLLTTEVIENPDLSDYETFLAVTRYRIANPPESYLTPEEFIGRLVSDEK